MTATSLEHLLFGRFLNFLSMDKNIESLPKNLKRVAFPMTATRPALLPIRPPDAVVIDFAAAAAKRTHVFVFEAANVKKSPQYIARRLLFGRFLNFMATAINTENVPKNLTADRFRKYWEQTDNSHNERGRFQAVLGVCAGGWR
jgi:hypothetical protein